MSFSSRLWFTLAVLTLLLSIVGVKNLALTPDNRVLLSPNDQRVVELLEFEDDFRPSNSVAFILHCDLGNTHCLRELPGLVRTLTDRAKELPFAISTESLATKPLIISDKDNISFANYLDFYCPQSCPPDLAVIMDFPKTLGRYISPGGNTFAIHVNLKFDTTSTHAVEDIYRKANQIISDIDIPTGGSLRFVGRVPLMQAFVDATNRELTGLMGLAIGIIFSLLWICLGNLRLTIVIVTHALLTIASTLGIAGWFGLVLSTASAALPTIIFTLMTTTSMHYFMHIVRIMSEDQNRDQKEVAYGAVRHQLVPTLITAGTTAAAMLSMLTVDSPPFQDIGLWTAVSLLIGSLYLFAVIPHVIARLPKIRPSKWQETIQPILNRHARYLGKRNYLTLIGLVLTILSATTILQLEVDDDFVRYFGEETKFRKDTEFVAQHLIGPTNIDVVIDSHTPGGVHSINFLKNVEKISEAIRANPKVDSVFSLIDILEPIGHHMLAGKSWKTASNSLVAQLLLTYELSLAEGQSINDLVDRNKQKTRISIIAKDISSTEIQALEETIYQLANKGGQYQTLVTGESIPLAHLSSNNIPGIAKSLALTLALISVILSLYFKSARIGCILLITTIVPVLCGFGLWSAFSETVGLAATVILSVCMGVVIDDSVHFIYRFKKDGIDRLGLGAPEAASYAVHRVGNAIMTTTMMLCLGFGVLALSSFEVNRTFGFCTVLILVFAMLIDLLILPSLLSSQPMNREQKSNG